jgi:hypothetical protein
MSVAGYVIVDQGSIPGRHRTFSLYYRVEIRSINNYLYTYSVNLPYKTIVYSFPVSENFCAGHVECFNLITDSDQLYLRSTSGVRFAAFICR